MTTVVALLLVVRVFDRSGASLQDRQAALRAANTILQQAEVTTRWVDCSNAGTPPAPDCGSPVGPGELLMRITPGPPTPAGTQQQLGYSLITPASACGDPGIGVLATVFSDRIIWLADLAGERPSLLMGRAIAHEIGHLLLGTNEHSSAGLMRAVWTPADVWRHRREDWIFSAADAARLRNSRITDQDRRLARGAGSNTRPSS